MRELLRCRWQQCFGLSNMMTVHKCSETGFFNHLNYHAFWSLYLRKHISYQAHLFFQNVQNLMKISKIQKRIQKIFLVSEITAFKLVALNTHFYWQRILVIGSECVNKQSQDFRYGYDRIFWTEVFSEWWKNMTKLPPCIFEWCLWPFNMMTVHKCSGTGLFSHLSIALFAVYNFGNTSAVRLIFSFKMFKIWCRFQKYRKKIRKNFRFPR